MIAATMDQDLETGKTYESSIRRQVGEPYMALPVFVLRRATREEFIEWHEENGLRWDLRDGEQYFEISID